MSDEKNRLLHCVIDSKFNKSGVIFQIDFGCGMNFS